MDIEPLTYLPTHDDVGSQRLQDDSHLYVPARRADGTILEGVRQGRYSIAMAYSFDWGIVLKAHRPGHTYIADDLRVCSVFLYSSVCSETQLFFPIAFVLPIAWLSFKAFWFLHQRSS